MPAFALQEGLPDVYINEYLKQNKYSLTDSDGERQPWAELYNASQREITLSDYYLSDDAQDAWKWRLPAVTLKPGEYLIVFLSGRSNAGGAARVLALGSSDTHLTLTSLTGGLRQVITLPSQYSDQCFLRAECLRRVEVFSAADAGRRQYYGGLCNAGGRRGCGH